MFQTKTLRNKSRDVSRRRLKSREPQLCLSAFVLSDSLKVITEMIDQVMSSHPDTSWFHIGADEVCYNDKQFLLCVVSNKARTIIVSKATRVTAQALYKHRGRKR